MIAGARDVTRRSFLASLAVGSVGLLAAACGSAAAPSSPTAAPGSSASSAPVATQPGGAAPSAAVSPVAAGEKVAGVRLPVYAPASGPTPDLPSRGPGVADGYVTFPSKLTKSVPQPPGHGGTVTTITQTLFSPPPPVDENPAWQEVNKRLNVELKMNVVGNADYRAKLGTVMAGSDLPDFIYIVIPTQSLPQFLQAQCADLTPYLSGDAVK